MSEAKEASILILALEWRCDRLFAMFVPAGAGVMREAREHSQQLQVFRTCRRSRLSSRDIIVSGSRRRYDLF